MAVEEQIPSVWARPEKRRREQPALSRDHIVAEAIALLDTEGVAALSMRKLGARLNAGATSLYTHVTNKEELLELVLDQVMGEIPSAPADGDWQERVLEVSRQFRAMILRHPWVSPLFGEVASMNIGPNMLRISDSMLGIFEDVGFSDDDADDAANVVSCFIIGSAGAEAAFLNTLSRAGSSISDWMQRFLPTAAQASRPFPRMHRRYTAYGKPDTAPPSPDDSFDTRLRIILKGIAAGAE
ncbi:MAG: TetR/AcrR family transcriptional regulator [Mycobacteriaceae bacterium]|nr:TetR/AcrR family transcriptional regulator [Mycobacteriaceae bacterium]